MKTRCPECATEYPLVPAVLEATRGVARCAECEHVFNAFDHRINRSETQQAFTQGTQSLLHKPVNQHSTTEPNVIDSTMQPMFADDARRHHAEAKLSDHHPWQVWLCVLLSILLIAQLFWANRAMLLGLSLAQPLCEWVDCSVAEQRAPEAFKVIEREFSRNVPDVLRVRLRFRNEASFAQPLPQLSLHLFDTNEYLVARRRLAPDEYLPDTVIAGMKVQPGEIIHVDLAFTDPGIYASGFRIDFL